MSSSLCQVGSVSWVTGAEDPWEALCFGTARGNIIFWRQNTRLVSIYSLISVLTAHIYASLVLKNFIMAA